MSGLPFRYRTEPDHAITGYPAGVPYIIGNEGCERFSFYGMRAILWVFLKDFYIANSGLAEEIAKQDATSVTHLFNTGVYALPMIGAAVADRLWGKYNTILYLSLVYCLGHLCLAIFESNISGFYFGLALIAIGSGGIKPCVSANVGDQFGKGNWDKLQRIYQAFYFIINFGSCFATLLIPLVREHYGNAWAFGIPGILMAVATIFFWAGRKSFVHVPAKPGGWLGVADAVSATFLFLTVGSLFFTAGSPLYVVLPTSAACLAIGLVVFFLRQKKVQDDGFLAMTLHALQSKLGGKDAHGSNAAQNAPLWGSHWLYGATARRFGDEAAEGPLAVWRIISVFFLVSMFWALFDQHSSTWIQQAEAMDLHIPALVVGGVEWLGPMDLLASQVPASNPVLVMLLIPLTAFGLYPLVEKYAGVKLTPLRRMTLGMLVAATSFAAVAVLQARIDAAAPEKIHVVWQLIPYVLLTVSEVMVSVSGLEFAYSQAPRRMKSTVMGFWMLTIALGNVFVALLAHFGDMPPERFFWFFAGAMAVAGVLFGVRAAFYKEREYTQ